MKTTPAALKAAQAAKVTTLATCVIIARRDGVTLRLTAHDRNLTVSGHTYHAAGGAGRSALAQSSGLRPDNGELRGAFDSDLITPEDIRAGAYLGAEVWTFEVDYTDPSLGIDKLDYGRIGRITHDRGQYRAELRGLGTLLEQTIGAKRSRYCRARLGDATCGIDLQPAPWTASQAVALLAARRPNTYNGRRYVCTTAGTTGTTEPTWPTTLGATVADGTAVWTCFDAYTKEGSVTGAVDRQAFVDSTRTEPDNWFAFGTVTWLTGDNAGLSMDCKSYASGSFLLKVPMPFPIAAGDAYTATAGCNHLLKMPGDTRGQPYTGDCRAKFRPEAGGNAVRFDGDPEQPSDDQLLAGPR